MRTVPPTTSRARIWCLVAIAAAAPMVVVACGDDDKAAGTTSTTTTAPASVSVSGQWVRAAAMGTRGPFAPGGASSRGGGLTLWQGLAPYDGGEVDSDGPRHRLWMMPDGWRYERK